MLAHWFEVSQNSYYHLLWQWLDTDFGYLES